MKKKLSRLHWLGLTIVACLLQPAIVCAQKEPVRVDFLQLYAPRSQAPIPIQLQITPNTPALVEGQFVFVMSMGREFLGSLTTEEIAVNPTGQRMRWLLPCPSGMGYSQQIDLLVQFQNKSGKYDFGPFPLRVTPANARSFQIGITAPPTMTMSKETEALLESLKFETYTPLADDRSLTTGVASIIPVDLPGDPLGLCAFNLLFLTEEGFSTLREGQLKLILEWVEAGGSACVIPRGGLSPMHVDWLNETVPKSLHAAPFVLGPRGDLMPDTAKSTSQVYPFRRGLGRMAVVHWNPDSPLGVTSQDWREAVANLWAMRADQRSSFRAEGKWDHGPLQKEQQLLQQRASSNPYMYQYYSYNQVRAASLPLGYSPISSGDQLVNRILPTNLKLVPLPLIGLLLLVYVLLIGPGDYFILGKFNIRKWTWVTFPVTTLVFTFAAFQLTDWYMNVGDTKRKVVFADVGIEGKLERVSALQMLFNSRQKLVETQCEKMLFTPLNHQLIGTGAWRNFSQVTQYGGRDANFIGPANCYGRIPTKFVARQFIPQWTPQLNRTLSLATEDYEIDFDWQQFAATDNLQWRELAANTNYTKEMIAKIRNKFGSHAEVYVLQGLDLYCLTNHHSLFESDLTEQQQQMNTPQYRPYNAYTSHQQVGTTQVRTAPADDFLVDVSAVRDAGLFSVVSQMAPHCGTQLEDLTLLDSSDTAQWLLVVALPTSDDWTVYRKLYAGVR